MLYDLTSRESGYFRGCPLFHAADKPFSLVGYRHLGERFRSHTLPLLQRFRACSERCIYRYAAGQGGTFKLALPRIVIGSIHPVLCETGSTGCASPGTTPAWWLPDS